ncbi:MAG: TfoX/Sxy family protein [Candidatus Cloacimonadaceae bacterium]|jgi:TfoX/Sxy family transcriptional regulator of competence genes|nr:TfoX/Sxy family protein [Candidatus Cloacimonadota bacterium]MDY0127841.1 TfoX/Sxy family protein [Candidatus Cloacimonadaceae bacterium]MCB5254089.1 TfoX/Sxy family protein [Candidatus Cloacimonadota bacterium]MCK9178209.1 TfoX/Sxy family protein [Candidatus Cloacimonadota bacterium]MCK9242607.1 TfoX/Sxy family protein [Candidatus Cloacimonadota bacterium]
MASRQEIVDYIVAQVLGSGAVRSRKMFGEYSIYCKEKVVALVADDQLYVKPTEGGRAYLQDAQEAPPYPGAKLYFLIPEDRWDDAPWLTQLIRITQQELPLPKKKPKRSGTKK